MAKDKKIVKFRLECSVCKNRNYSSTKNKKNVTGKLKLRKYCKYCRKTTEHKETK